MGRLLQLLLRNGGFVTLVFVELFCFMLIVNYNTSQAVIWANTTDIFGGRLMERRQRVSDYFSLQERADSLANVVDSLQERLAYARYVQVPVRDTFYRVTYDSLTGSDSIRRKYVRPLYEYVSARVVENSVTSVNNWLLINRGKNDRVEPHTAVVTPDGVVGIVRHVSDNFSIVMSVLHSQTRITASVEGTGAFGSLEWDGNNPEVMSLRNISKHFKDKILPGARVVTSGYSLMVPRDIPVGIVEALPTEDSENPHFLEVKVRLGQSMSDVNDVSVVRNLFSPEIDSLKSKIKR
jgi:rod shape-determining protein MreC